MAAIGSLVFCTACGNLLPATKGTDRNSLRCEACGAWNQDTGAKMITTQSKPSDFPSALRQKLQSNVQAVERHTLNTEMRINERCPKCGREEVNYTNVQLRGADEGSTVIFMCDCGHSWQQDN
ncbi:Putative DNA-directed RNA polymerase subunit [[Torrubiella] hemipterigena]|uniref:DNA-directed RNA polymerase subunit n=1 Tax=[Torrubiella] hemipterigena TaxID=1531966 RepID=A0A0A1SZ76_9HYPO|nr:Putative DNA-directed RNA polymerase subunit [[Torrubiella] hemipterigena]